MLSDSESLVVFADRSFITDKLIYNSETGEKISRTGEPVDETYFEQMRTTVKGLFEYSAGILNGDFYRYVNQAATCNQTMATDVPADIGAQGEKTTPDSDVDVLVSEVFE